MKVVHLSTSDRGGAGIAAMRLHHELLNNGVDSKILTHYRIGSYEKQLFIFSQSKKEFILIRVLKSILSKFGLYKPIDMRISEKYLKNRPEVFEYFSFPFSNLKLEKHPIVKKADIIHLHWVAEGFLNYPSFFKFINKKIVWTLHDMNPFTGGCHHSDDCDKYKSECRRCPQLKGTIDDDYAFKMQSLKKKSLSRFHNDQIKIVTPSTWLKQKSLESELFRRFAHFQIPNGINTSVFFPCSKIEARNQLKLPPDKKLLLFVSHSVDNKRKGIQYLKEALENILMPDIAICTIGKNEVNLTARFPQFNLGFIEDDHKMSLAYNAADIFVLPSVAENFPNTTCESLLCGTPVVAFNVGGLPEQVNNNNGLLVKGFDTRELAKAIQYVLDSPDKFNASQISSEARMKFDIRRITKKYIELYQSF